MPDKLWWQKPVKYIQYNSQVRDTHLMDAERIAEQTRK